MNSVTRSRCSGVRSFVTCFYCNESFRSLSSLMKHFCSAEQNSTLELEPLEDFSNISIIDLNQEDPIISTECFSEEPPEIPTTQGTAESNTNIVGENSFSETEYEKASPCAKEQELANDTSKEQLFEMLEDCVLKVVTNLVNDVSENRLTEQNPDVVAVVTNLVNDVSDKQLSEINFKAVEVPKQATEASNEQLQVLDTEQKNTEARFDANEEFNATSPDLVSKVLQYYEKQTYPGTPNNFCKSPSMEIEFQSSYSPLLTIDCSSPRHDETQTEGNAADINTNFTSEKNCDSNRENETQNESETSKDNIKPQVTNVLSTLSPIKESITKQGNMICNAIDTNTSLSSEKNCHSNRENKTQNESETSKDNIKPQATNLVSTLSPIIESITTQGNILSSQSHNVCSTPLPRVESDSSNMFSRSSSVEMELDSLGCDDNQADMDDSETSNTLLTENRESITTQCNIKSLQLPPFNISSTPSAGVESDSSNMFSRSSSPEMELDSLGCDDNQADSDDSETSNTLLADKEGDLVNYSNAEPEKLPIDNDTLNSFLEKELNKTSHHPKMVLKSCYVKVQDIFKSVKNTKVSRQKISYWNKKLHVCDMCDKFFQRKTDLNMHYLSHTTTKQFVCSLCNRSFMTQSNLFAHHFAHTVKRKHKCSVCKKSFTRKSHLIRHKSTHSEGKPFTCVKCDKSYRLKSSLTEHYLTHSDARPFVCEICSQAFSNKRYLRKHYYSHQKKSEANNCDLCFKTFRRRDHLEAHYNLHTNERPHKCKICNKAFHFLLTLNHHYSITHRGTVAFEPPVSEKTPVVDKIENNPIFVSIGTPAECNLAKNPIFPIYNHVCGVCNKTFSRSDHLEEHYNIHTDKRPHKCKLCNKAFHLLLTLNRHEIIYHRVKSALMPPVSIKTPVHCKLKKNPNSKSVETSAECNIEKNPIVKTQNHVCDVCNKAYTRKHHLEEHYNVHTDKKPHKCSICNKAFHLLLTLNHHYCKAHGKEKQIRKDTLVCKICSKTFKRKIRLDDHNIHTNSRPHICKVCNLNFQRVVNLNNHCLALGKEKTLKYTAPEVCKTATDPVIEKIKVVAEVHRSDKNPVVETPIVQMKKDTFTYNTRRKSSTPKRYLQPD